jgi:hypothetical protein
VQQRNQPGKKKKETIKAKKQNTLARGRSIGAKVKKGDDSREAHVMSKGNKTTLG